MPPEIPTNPVDDFELMRLIACGDSQALAAFYDRHGGIVLALGVKMLKNRAEAEDLLVDVFWEIWQKAQRYDANRAAPLTYLMMVARSRALDRRRAGDRHAAPLDESIATSQSETAISASDPPQSAILSERRTEIRQAMGQLDAAQRQVIELSFFSGLSHSQIAEKLDKPLGTIKTYIRQGLIRLRECLRKD